MITPNPECTANRHSNSVRAYAAGCRCDGAIAGYKRKLAMDIVRLADAPKRVRYRALDDSEPDYVAVFLAVEGRMPFGYLLTKADREAARVELERAA